MAQPLQQDRKTVFLVNIEKGSDAAGLFTNMYGGLLNLLKNNPSLHLVTIDSVSDFLQKCVGVDPIGTVLLFTNEIVTKPKNKNWLKFVKSFVSGGGLAIFGCHFSSFTKSDDMNAFFSSLGLPWTSSDYNRATFGITSFGKSLLTGVEEKFSVKALQLANVEQENRLYTPVGGGTTQSHVFPHSPTNPNLAMATFKRLGNGAVAYVGDVNAEDSSNRLTFALCQVNW